MSSSDQQVCDLSTESWLRQVLNYLDKGMQCVLVTIVETKGSTPRNIGTQMIITADGIWQTIGGGALEFDLMAKARVMLVSSGSSAWGRDLIKVTLGPDMGQCCGGRLSLLLEKFGSTEEPELKVIAAAADVNTKWLRQAAPNRPSGVHQGSLEWAFGRHENPSEFRCIHHG